MTKIIQETKCTCKGCGNTWFYDKKDEAMLKAEKWENAGKQMSQAGKSMMCCGGCLPALFIPNSETSKVKELDVCDKCRSKAIEKETVTYHVE